MLTKTHSLPFPFLFSLSKRWHVPNAFCRLERQSRGLMAEAYCIFNWKYLSLLQLKYNIKTIDYEKVFGITDLDGRARLKKVPDGYEVEISYVGYKSQTIKMTGSTTYIVSLREDSEVLDEVVVL